MSRIELNLLWTKSYYTLSSRVVVLNLYHDLDSVHSKVYNRT